MSTHLSKTDSEVSSLTPSSPTQSSPRRPVYYVQSPSRDSHDGEKTTNSFQSSPAALSPAGSPPHSSSHSNSSLGPPSRKSSSTRFSGSLRPIWKGKLGRGTKSWKDGRFDAIEEEGLLGDEGNDEGLIPRRCYFVAFVVGFFVLFSFFALVLWGASRNQKPSITVKSIVFEQFVIQAGVDHTGVTTEMVSMNSTVRLIFRNSATFFGLHVRSTPLELYYSELTVAAGNIDKFYQSRRSGRSIGVTLVGKTIPLYGGGSNLRSVNGVPTQPVPLALTFLVSSRGYVLGKLVKTTFHVRVACDITMDPNNMNVAIPLTQKCVYEHD
ncbi:hypothetical protein MLD38_031440 [Melastoma candidum]|uniref:Uncharacterized protein n=1 Tax=Melastoma candidum TaxID=119954 RepID=A0ACB9MPP4_9MYRT|nr:hypothetical protein MLD38_031440 [Melastoma candidum]